MNRVQLHVYIQWYVMKAQKKLVNHPDSGYLYMYGFRKRNFSAKKTRNFVILRYWANSNYEHLEQFEEGNFRMTSYSVDITMFNR